jgi:hypothetical protein
LENDRQQVMILGAISCPDDLSRSISKRIKAIKKKHDLSPTFEIKWKKVSPAKIDFYMDLLSYFFEEKELSFRALIVPDKTQLRHEEFDHDHDTWYYKMYFGMLKVLLYPQDCYYIYLDIKDSNSGQKITKLHDVLCHNAYDFERQIIERVQTVRSHEVDQLQLADLLMGCVLAANRTGEMSGAKKALMERMRKLSKYCLTKTTLIREKKVNLLRWKPSDAAED